MGEYIITIDESKADPDGGMPIKDKREVVRCHDCEFAAYEGTECMRVDEWDDSLWFPVEPDGFCAWGEKVMSE